MITLPTSSTNLVVPETPARVKRELLTQLDDSSDYLLVLDNTSCETFTTCPLSALYYLVYRREAHAKNAALTFGGAIHAGLHEYYLGNDVAAQDHAITQYFLDNPSPPDEYRTAPTALAVMRHYRVRATFDDYHWTLLRDDAGPLLERAFELPLCVIEVNRELQLPSWPEPKFVASVHCAWSGRIDALAVCNNAIRIVDHKTSSIDGDQFVQSFQLSNQVLGYLWAARQLWPDYAPSAFCLNAIRLKRHIPGADLVAKGPRGGEPPLKFYRAYFDYSPDRMAQWEANAKALISDLVHCLVREYFPAYTKSCFNKYGQCQYHDVCIADDPMVRKALLASDLYRNVTWDPTH
jgi:hypothetical protein